MLEKMPKTVPLAGVMIDVVHDQPDCTTSPLGTHAAKPGSDQLGSGVEVEGKSYCPLYFLFIIVI